MRPWHHVLVLTTVVLALTSTVPAQHPALREVLPKIPPETNALMLVDVEALHQSPLGRQEKWAERHAAEFLTGKVTFPPEASLVVFAAHIEVDPAGAQRTWELGLLSLSRAEPAPFIAKREQGSLETVAGYQAVLTPRQLYIVPLTNRLVGVHSPAKRHNLARWLQFCQSNQTPVITPWLQSATSEFSRDTPLILAIHLEDAVKPRQIRRYLGLFQAALPPQTDLDGLAHLLASAKGMRLALQVKEEITAELRIEFSKPVKPFEPLLHVVLAFSVKTLGVGLPDLKSWTMEIGEQTVIFQNTLTSEELNRLWESLQPQATPANLSVDAGKR